MSKLSWGKPKIEICELTNGAEGQSPVWSALPDIKQGTVQLNTENGNKTEALDEGGEVVDVRYDKSKYSLSVSLYIKKGDSKPIEDADGIITKEYAVRLTPEDAAAMGFKLKRCHVSSQETWTSADGGIWVYTFDALKPLSGKMLERFNGINITPSKTSIAKAGETVTIAVETSGSTITASCDPSSVTPTVSGNTVTVIIPNNSGSTVKTFTVTVSNGDGASASVVLTQAGS